MARPGIIVMTARVLPEVHAELVARATAADTTVSRVIVYIVETHDDHLERIAAGCTTRAFPTGRGARVSATGAFTRAMAHRIVAVARAAGVARGQIIAAAIDLELAG